MSETQADEKPVRGTGGWLLLFIVLGFLGTFAAARNLILEYKSIADYFNISSGTKFSVYLYFIAQFFWVAIYCYGIFRLIRVEKNAVKFIKFLLKIKPIVFLVSPYAALLSWHIAFPDLHLFTEERLGKMYDSHTVWNIVGACVSSLIWHKYFSVSVRVKNTWAKYGLEPQS